MRLGQARRRFYRQTTVVADGDGYAIRLDGRPLRTPAGSPLNLPSRPLAAAIAAEWQAQTELIEPATMPLTQLAMTAADRVAPQRAAVVEELLNYAATDLVCYRAEGPADLVLVQHRVWQPLIDWLAERWHVSLHLAVGVMPIAQPPAALAALRQALSGRSDFELAALATIVQASGSLVIGLALADGGLDAAGASAAALLDEEYQAERWGRDEPAERRRTSIRDDIGLGRRLLDLLAGQRQTGGNGDASSG